jgi:nucleoside-diphosphate-sugar epimerase
MEILRHSLLLDTRRARDELGWRPRRAGVKEILAGM